MSVRLIVDGVVEFDGPLGSWVQRPPEFIRRHLEPGTPPLPWMKAVMLSISDSVLLGTALDIDVRTWSTGWSMSVERR
jgi:hypothetical protein